MTPLSWIFMLTVWAIILGLNVFCFYKILRKPRIEPIDESQDNGDGQP